MGPLKGRSNNNNNDSNNRKRTDVDGDEDIESDFSEQGYSASEEEIFDVNKKTGRTKPMKKKSRTRSTGFVKQSGYMTLDDPTSHASYV